MSLKALIIGISLQPMFAVFQFLAVIFSVAGAANNGNLKPWQITPLDLSVIFLPSVSIVVSALRIYLYQFDSQYLSNWWHAIPFVILLICLKLVFSLNGK